MDGPSFASVTSQQLLQLRPDGTGTIRLELENPRELGDGLACYSVTVTHHETGRTYTFYGGLRGRRVRSDLAPR